MRWAAVAFVLGVAGVVHGQASGPGPAPARGSSARLVDPKEARTRLGVSPTYDGVAGVEAIKVAVLDYGFAGAGPGALPPGAVVVEHYEPEFIRKFGLGDPEYRKPFEPGNKHGRVMAQIVWAASGLRPGGPKFYLLNANGPTLFRRAVRYAIEQKVDIILFSGAFEGGGNGDGRGPINRAVAEAISAEILWINAAGNYGKHVYNGPVRVLNDGYLKLREGSDVASLRFRNHLDDNAVTITLTWDDYRGEEDAGTDKDLDLYVEDWTGRRVGSGEKVQVGGAKEAGPDESRNPRERVVLTSLPASPDRPGDPEYAYRIRIRAKRGRFTTSDRLRILITSAREAYLPPGGDTPREAVEFVDASGRGEIFPPADSPFVLTVGDGDPSSSVGPTADGRAKPDAILDDSRAVFTDGEASAGTSDAAAYVAGAVVVLKAAGRSLRWGDLLRLAHGGPAVPADRSPRKPAVAGLRYWKTPTRARLAEVLGTGR